MRLLKALVMGTAIMMMSQVVMAVDSVEVHEMPELVYREPPYANMFPATSVDEELWDIEEFFGEADGTRTASCEDECHYHYDAMGNYEIHCEVPSWAWTNVVVGMNKYSEDGEVIMCTFSWGHWNRIGSCDLDGVVKLLVDGSSHDDKIGIIKTGRCENGEDCDPVGDCDFGDFIDDFDYDLGGQLRMYGRDDCDWIWGSQWSDYALEGEYVFGMEGDDVIELENNDVSCIDGHPSALGGAGDDIIWGSVNSDYIWADDVGMTILQGAGGDVVRGQAGSDYIYMGDVDDGEYDYCQGDDRTDYIWGTAGSNYLYGNDSNDWIYGGTGNDDYCHGGTTSFGDHCDQECETRVACNSW